MSCPSICFATVCGTPVDYEFLLGAIREHSTMGCHVVLDVTPALHRKQFKRIPSSVMWVAEDGYLSNTRMFKFHSALLRVNEIARATGAEVIVNLDSDEFFAPQATEKLFPLARNSAVEHLIVTWGCDNQPHARWDAWLRRIWPSKMNVRIPRNEAWTQHPEYDGNPELHPIPMWPPNARVTKTQELVHHHLHWTIHHKGHHPFSEWPVAGWCDWPPLLKRWKEKDIPPSLEFL